MKIVKIKIIISALFLGSILFLSCNSKQNQVQNQIPFSKTLNNIEQQLRFSEDIISSEISKSEKDLVSPRSVNENGSLRMVPAKDWCSGFYPGVFWEMAKLTGEAEWKVIAEKYTAPLEAEKWNGNTHDMGFKMFCSFGNGYLQTSDPVYRDILIQSAKTLVTRYNEKVGCIRSWDFNSDEWDFPVIIDNMMNLELLFWASSATGDSMYSQIAVKHAETTLKHHFRADNSCYHVVDYNPETGEVQHKQTHQGFSDESSWSRGQAWALYGYTMCYRETKNHAFLKQAEKVAAFIMDHKNMPDDKIPYWDFDAPNIPNEPRDASAAAVIASALYELSTYCENGEKYKNYANQITESLCSDSYLAKPGTNNGFILKHSTGSKPHNSEIDVPLIYADYYFVEALNRKNALSSLNDQKVD
ncbi:glycoside hydrolase family 88 protein [uncultured Draconibacterium sp.]|uniref:glycoside hydrolase family 88 protein n=1 Tax=uncultured Draconibacterium sp. TaxID=1573823 RepID=UPI003216CC53